MSETLKVIRSQLSAAGLQVFVQCGEDVVAAVTTGTTTGTTTIVDMLGRQLRVDRPVVNTLIVGGGGIVSIWANAPPTDPESDPPSYQLTMGGSSTWFAPASLRALPQDDGESKPPPGAASIDYLGRDYTHFVTMMRSRVAEVVQEDSAWALDHPADPMTTILEVLAYAGDHLSFRQDAAGTKSYLTMARRRLSLRRHGRLRDYAVNDGCNARTVLVFAVNDNGVLPQGLQVVTQQPGQSKVILPPDAPLVASSTIFETMHRQPVSPKLNDLGYAFAPGAAYIMPAGTIALTLHIGGTGLVPGQLIVLSQPDAPAGVSSPFGAQALRLLEVEEKTDPQTKVTTTVLSWHPEDALARPLTVPPAKVAGSVSLYGNVVLADHGQTVSAKVSPDTVRSGRPYRPTVLIEDVVSAAPYPQVAAAFDGKQDLVRASLMVKSAKASLAPQPRAAVPCIAMHGMRPAMTSTQGTPPQIVNTVTDDWQARQDLLSAAPTERAFAVSLEDAYGGDERHLHLEFGDGELGYRPAPGTIFKATARTGGGQTGRVRANSLRQVVGTAPLVMSVSNPLAAAPSLEEPSEAIRLFATTAFRTNLRGIEPADWDHLGRADPLVTEVNATYNENGLAPCTVALTTSATTPDDDVAFNVARARLLQYAVLGAQPEIKKGRDVPLDIAVVVYCASGTNIGAARQRLLQAIGTGSLPDGSPAFFNPANWPLGRSVRLDELTAAIEADPWVSFVTVDPGLDTRVVFQTIGRGDDTTSNFKKGYIEIGWNERARVGNDDFQPALGRVGLYVVPTS